MRNSVNHLILRRMLCYTDVQQLHHTCPLIALGGQTLLIDIWAWVCSNSVTRWSCMCYTMVYKLTEVNTNDTCHYYAKNYLPLAYENARPSSRVSKCYSKCHNTDIFSLWNLLMLTNGFMLAIKGCDAWDFRASSLGHAQIVCVDAKYHKWCIGAQPKSSRKKLGLLGSSQSNEHNSHVHDGHKGVYKKGIEELREVQGP